MITRNPHHAMTAPQIGQSNSDIDLIAAPSRRAFLKRSTALGLADDVVVLEVYAPGETPIPGASGSISKMMPMSAKVHRYRSRSRARFTIMSVKQ